MGSAAAATNAYDDDDDHDDDDDEDPSCFNVNYTGGYGFTALALAARNGHLAVVQVLLADTRVAVDYRNKGGSTPLMEASGNGRTTIAVVLLLAGADIDAADTGGHTALEHAKCGGHGTLTAVLEAAASPPLVPGMPLSAQWWAAGVVFLPPTTPGNGTLAKKQLNLLRGEVGPWLSNVALPLAKDNPAVKQLVFQMISHMHTLVLNHGNAANELFTTYLLPAAHAQQKKLPAMLAGMAAAQGVDYALAPAALRAFGDHDGNGAAPPTPPATAAAAAAAAAAVTTAVTATATGPVAAPATTPTPAPIDVTQARFLAFLKPENIHVAEEVLAECMPKAAAMRQQAEAAVATLGMPTTRGYGVGRSNTFSRAKVHSLPTLLELIAAAICVVSTFVFNHLKATRPDLSPHPHAASPPPHAAAAPDVNKIRWPEVKTMMRMLAKMRSDYSELESPWAALLDTVRFSVVSKTSEHHAAFLQPFLPTGIKVGVGRGRGGGGINTGSSGSGLQTETVIEKDPELTAVRAKSTMDDPTATVKQELWNFAYTPDGVTFESMVGKGQ